MSSCRITVLGSSSGMPSPTRFCSSLFVQTEKFNFLVDCGEGTSYSLLRNNVDPELIDLVFISHSHIDHLGGLFLLIQMMHLLRRRIPLSVYLPQEAISGVRSFLDTCYLFPDRISLELKLHGMVPDFAFQGEGFTVKAHLNRHLAGNYRVVEELKSANQMQSFSFVLNLAGKKMVYSGDILHSDDLAGIIEDSDLVITECFHPQLEELIPLLVKGKVKSTILTHIPPELEGKEEEVVGFAEKMGLENIVMAYDGLAIGI
ncbi:MAG: MBL fold metallo-hydrolase [Candidatus Zixiibacteriota bacterium]